MNENPFRAHREKMNEAAMLQKKFQGLPDGDLRKIVADNRKYSPQQRKEAQIELDARQKVDEGYKVGDKVNVTNPNASPRHRIIAKNDTHYTLKRPDGTTLKLAKSRIAKVNKDAWDKAKQDPEALEKRKKQTNEETLHEEAPANNTGSAAGTGDDKSVHMKKMRMWKAIHRRHRLPEETEQLDEISKGLAWNYAVFSKDELKDIEHTHGKDPNKWPKEIQKKALNRAKGMTNARKRLVGENTEQLDEISVDLKKRYLDKAEPQAKSFQNIANMNKDIADKDDERAKQPGSGPRIHIMARNARKSADKWQAKADKRAAGVRMAKEEVEQIDELSRNTLDSYRRKSLAQGNPLETRKNKDNAAKINRIKSKKTLAGYKSKHALSPEEEKIRKKRMTGASRAMRKIDKKDGI